MDSLLERIDPTRIPIPPARFEALQDDSWFEISREHLQTLLTLADENQCLTDFIQFPQNEIWKTFRSTGTKAFTGKDLDKRFIPSDQKTLGLFGDAGILADGSLNPPGVKRAMKESNCLFIGSPKTNDSTGKCLNLLFPDGQTPFWFRWPDWAPARHGHRFCKTGKLGISYYDHKGQLVEANDADDSKDGKDDDETGHTGVLVVCRSPLPTTIPVTSVVVAGCTKYGTEKIARDLCAGAVFVPTDQLVDGRPSVFVLQPVKRGIRWYSIDGARTIAARRESERTARQQKKANRNPSQ